MSIDDENDDNDDGNNINNNVNYKQDDRLELRDIGVSIFLADDHDKNGIPISKSDEYSDDRINGINEERIENVDVHVILQGDIVNNTDKRDNYDDPDDESGGTDDEIELMFENDDEMNDKKRTNTKTNTNCY